MITVILSLTLMAKGALSQPRVKVLGGTQGVQPRCQKYGWYDTTSLCTF